MDAAESRSPVLWKQVLGLAAVQSAVSLMWVIYGAYLPQLLGEFGLPQQLGLALLVVENGIAIALQPIMGGLSDRAQRWVGTRFPFIAVGVILASALFIGIPLGAMLSPALWTSRLVLFVLVSWALAMTVFHSPVLSLLGHYTDVRHLPLAASLLTLASAVVGTTQPVVSQSILSLGPLATFLIGSIVVLLVAAMVLRSLDMATAAPLVSLRNLPPIPWRSLPLIAGLGLGVGWGNRLVFETLRRLFLAQFPDQPAQPLMTGIALALAITAVPAGLLASRLGSQRILGLGLSGAIALALLVGLFPYQVLLIVSVVLFVGLLSVILNGTIPFALLLMPPARAGLGVGAYLGGFAAATCWFGAIARQMQTASPTWTAWWGAGALAVALVCVVASGQLSVTPPLMSTENDDSPSMTDDSP